MPPSPTSPSGCAGACGPRHPVSRRPPASRRGSWHRSVRRRLAWSSCVPEICGGLADAGGDVQGRGRIQRRVTRWPSLAAIDAGHAIAARRRRQWGRGAVIGAEPTPISPSPTRPCPVGMPNRPCRRVRGLGDRPAGRSTARCRRRAGAPADRRRPAAVVSSAPPTSPSASPPTTMPRPTASSSRAFNRPPRHRPPGPVAESWFPDPPVEGSRVAFDAARPARTGPRRRGDGRGAGQPALRRLRPHGSAAARRVAGVAASPFGQGVASSARRFRAELTTFERGPASASALERARLEVPRPRPSRDRPARRHGLDAPVGATARPRRPPRAATRARRSAVGAACRRRACRRACATSSMPCAAVDHRAPVSGRGRSAPGSGGRHRRRPRPALALARSLLLQAAVLHGPADLADRRVRRRRAAASVGAGPVGCRTPASGAESRPSAGAVAAAAAAEMLSGPARSAASARTQPRSGCTCLGRRRSESLLRAEAHRCGVCWPCPRRWVSSSPRPSRTLPGCCARVVTVDDLGDADRRAAGAGVGPSRGW